MDRRQLIKSLTALSALSLIPGTNLLGINSLKKLHIIGLGTAGTNIAVRLKQHGIVGKYTCITRFPSFIEPIQVANFINGFFHIEYDYRLEFATNYELGKEKQPKLLTIEMQERLSDHCFYIILVGLGGWTGTSLIQSTLEFLTSTNKQYLAICQLPFEFDGEFRTNFALAKQAEIEKYKGVYFLDHHDFQNRSNIQMLSELFSAADEEIVSFVKAKLPKSIKVKI